jgi:hypothetical protein
MMGMMTLIRVLPDREYEEMTHRIKTTGTPEQKEHSHGS